MRSGGVCSIQHSLTPEAASVLKHSLLLSRRRGHAQLTPLHVAAVLLSSSSSTATLLKRACVATNCSLQSPRAALDLCFNVALNRLPTAAAAASQPTLSNALVAALKRAQSHHRRGSSAAAAAENPSALLTVKVDIEQLVISILDDPSVSRVMREAGFSSTAVKTTVVEGGSNITVVKDGVLGLSFHANYNYNNSSVHGSRIMLSHQNQSHHQLISNKDDHQYLPNYYQHNNNMNNYSFNNYNYKLSFCSECASNCEKEVELMKTGNQKLPAWLRPHGTQPTPQKDEVVELRKKWSRLCHSLHHQGNHITQNQYYNNNNIQSLVGNKSYVPWCPNNQNRIIFHDTKNSITFADHIDQQADPGLVGPKLDSLRSSSRQGNDDEEEKNITLGLGNLVGPRRSVGSSRDEMCRVLKDSVPWQSEAIPSIVEAVIAKKETWLVLQGNDSIGKRRLARAIAESVLGSADSLVLFDASSSGRRNKMETLEKALGSNKKLVVLVEEIDNISFDARLLKLLSDRFESRKFGEECVIFVLTKSDGDERRVKGKDSVIEMTLEIGETRGFLDLKRKAVGSENPNYRRKSPRIDLNIEAESDEEEEMSRDSSDLTRENDIINGTMRASFFESVENVFEFNRSPARDREMKEFFEAKMISGCFNGEEIVTLMCGKKVRFSVDESVLEEVSFGSCCFTNSLFEKWVIGVFENALKTVVSFSAKEKGKNGILCGVGGGDGLVVRLCLGGEKKEGINLVDGFMGSCLPNKIQISYKD